MSQLLFPLGVTGVMLPELDFDKQMDLCSEFGLTHYSLRPRIIAPEQKSAEPSNWGRHIFDLTPERLVKEGRDIAAQLSTNGLVPFGTVPSSYLSDSEDDLKQHFEGAAIVGAGRVRVNPVAYSRNQPMDYQKLLKEAIQGYERAIKIAKSFNQKIVIETHSYSLTSSPALALNICQHFDPQDLGVIFDLANFHIEGALTPVLAVAVIGKYIDHVHIGASKRVYPASDAFGFETFATRGCALTQSHLHLPSYIKALHEANIHVPLILEDYTPNMSGEARFRRSAIDLKAIVESIQA